MLEMRLYNNNLTVRYNRKTVSDETTFCSRHCISYSYDIQYDKYDLTAIKIKKNFKIVPLKNNYIIYNEKNQAIIDANILNILDHLYIEEINQDLLEMLYKLKFIINE